MSITASSQPELGESEAKQIRWNNMISFQPEIRGSEEKQIIRWNNIWSHRERNITASYQPELGGSGEQQMENTRAVQHRDGIWVSDVKELSKASMFFVICSARGIVFNARTSL